MRFSRVLPIVALLLGCALMVEETAGIKPEHETPGDAMRRAEMEREKMRPGSRAHQERRNAVLTGELMKFHEAFKSVLDLPRPGDLRVLTREELSRSSDGELSNGLTLVPLGTADYLIVFKAGKALYNPSTGKTEDGQSPTRVKASDVQRLADATSSRGLVFEQLDKLTFTAFPNLLPVDPVKRRILEYKSDPGTVRIRPPESVLSIKVGAGRSAVAGAFIREHVRKSDTVILAGDPVPDQYLVVGLWGKDFVFQSPRSSNRSPEAVYAATDFGDRAFSTRPNVVLNALPNAEGVVELPRMLSRMKLSMWHTSAWRTIMKEVGEAVTRGSLGPRTRVANRVNLLRELESGTDNVLMLIAHNLERKIYFPDGTSIGFDEFATIRRSTPPDRAIILVTCEAGEIGGEMPSLAELMLQNNLARTVFASDAPVKGSQIAGMIRAITGQASLRKTLSGFGLLQLVFDEARALRNAG